MSLGEQNYDADIEVADDENYTDKKVKQRIQNTRQMVKNAEHELFSKRLVEPDVEYSKLDALLAWGDFVRSYIRDLSVLLNHPDMDGADYFREQVELGTIHLIPPDKDGYQFSQIAYDGIEEEDLLLEFDGFSRAAELPRPKTRTITGLMDLAEREPVVEARWLVTKNPRDARPNQETVMLETQRPIPRKVYGKALSEADQFLQNCGIGLDIEAEPYTADGEPGL
jgi:hypothetical protein